MQESIENAIIFNSPMLGEMILMDITGLKIINKALSSLKNDIKHIISYYNSNFKDEVELGVRQFKKNSIIQDEWGFHVTKVSILLEELEKHQELHKQLIDSTFDYLDQKNAIVQLVNENKIYLSIELDNILERLDDLLSVEFLSDNIGIENEYIPECILHCVDESEEIFQILEEAFLISKKDYSSLDGHSEKSIIKDLIWCCYRVQDDITFKLKKLKENNQSHDIENARNRAIRNLLLAKDYNVFDQSQCGQSSSGLNSGEVDLKIEYESMPVTYLEGLNQNKCLDKTCIKKHINKIYGYDKIGTAFNFIILYFDGDNFEKFYLDYLSLIKDSSTYEKYKLIDVLEDDSRYSEIKLYCSNLIRNGVQTRIYHILINFESNQSIAQTKKKIDTL